MSGKKKSHKKRIYVVSPVAYDASVYWPDTNILKTNHNVFNPAIRATDDEKPINWQLMQTRADVSYHASKNADSTWTRDGGEFISAIHHGITKSAQSRAEGKTPQ